MNNSEKCNSEPDACSSDRAAVSRRTFVKLAAMGAASVTTTGLPIMAGPFENENEYLKLIPTDKKLDPLWVRSLFERGEKEVYSDPKALSHIGMPVGGFFAGTVYLAGDGRLWLWEVFNRDQVGISPRQPEKFVGIGNAPNTGSGLNYLQPAPIVQPFVQGFAITVNGTSRTLDQKGFANVTFDGRYPIGRVTYRDDAAPVEVVLDAFSPFIPLNLDDSSLPATVMRYTARNTSSKAVECDLTGHLANAVCLHTGSNMTGTRRNQVVRSDEMTALVCSAATITQDSEPERPDIVFEDFEEATFEGWTVEGKAFGAAPIPISEVPDYQGDIAGKGQRVVNSHSSAPGDSVGDKDGGVGTLTSKPFKIERKFIHLLVGGGAHPGKTCVNLLIEGETVASVTGRSDNRMSPTTMNVNKYAGKQAMLQIVDAETGPWGNIGVDQIVFSDRTPTSDDLDEQRDFGTMTLALLGERNGVHASAERDGDKRAAESDLTDMLIGTVGRKLKLEPGQSATVSFALTWHFPNFYARGVGGAKVGHHYASRFDSALSVAHYIASNFERLAGDTQAWVETWYDSTLPFWLLDRTMANTSTLATTTCYRFADGRFWAWEGIGCCAGTCTHVWHYAQAPGRLFPELERIERETVNFGLGQHADGGVGMRTNLKGSTHAADDGQCGRILGVLREHQMSADHQFLQRLWPQVKRAIEFMIARDGDGLLGGAQPNTLDAEWYGKISFTSSLYLAALRAGATMARVIGDANFATQCDALADRGAESILECFNGEYFIQIEDPNHRDKIGIGPGCYIDQVFGQTWAHWVGLGTLFDRDKQLSALRALWKYNFVPDVGPFREQFVQGRWYATTGDAGLLMCTWPKGGQNAGFKDHWQYMYFNECMSGFEWQAAAHMIWEGHDQPDLLQAGLAISRAIHDRYNAALRNPYNEIECSDHYSRAMASYGVFQAACGCEYDGPRRHIGFAPRLSPENFSAPFTSAEGWGTYEQQLDKQRLQAKIHLAWGTLALKTISLQVRQRQVTSVTMDGKPIQFEQDGERVTLVVSDTKILSKGDSLNIALETGTC